MIQANVLAKETANYLIDHCYLEMPKLLQIGRHSGHAFILAPCHVCDELVKLHCLEFHGLEISIIEESKTPPQTLVKKTSTNAVANDQQSIHKMPSRYNDVTTAPTEEQHPIQNINSTFPNGTIPKKENIAPFLDSVPRGMEMKHLNSQVKEERIHLKVFPGAKTNQLNHHVIPNVRGIEL